MYKRQVLHTINLRLFPDQLVHVINHAEDKVVFIDEDLVPLLARIADQLTTVEKYIILSDKEELPEINLPNAVSYEKLLAEAPAAYDFPEDLDENSPAAMCYTTATTGAPKGVIYTHRSIYLHGMMVCLLYTSFRRKGFSQLFSGQADHQIDQYACRRD